jgi:hypothetical protein
MHHEEKLKNVLHFCNNVDRYFRPSNNPKGRRILREFLHIEDSSDGWKKAIPQAVKDKMK